MNIEVTGNSVSEILHSLRPPKESGWITIHRLSEDFGREPKFGYALSWSDDGESFVKKVNSSAELLGLLKPLLVARDKEVKQFHAKRAAERAAKRTQEAKDLRERISALQEELENLG